jgi:hypothetical protein
MKRWADAFEVGVKWQRGLGSFDKLRVRLPGLHEFIQPGPSTPSAWLLRGSLIKAISLPVLSSRK